MEFSQYFPIWNKLSKREQDILMQAAVSRSIPKGTVLHNGGKDCLGLIIVQTGQLRSYVVSEEGREVTIYRLFDRDICLLSASCMMPNIQFDIVIDAEKDTDIWIVPVSVFMKLMNESAVIANYANQILSGHFSEAMWLMEQIMWKSFDKRLAAFLLEESILDGSKVIQITHEKIANHMGTAREVVTRMLRYFQSEGMVKITRGAVEIVDENKLRQLTE